MGVFKKLTGNDVRVTPLQVKKKQSITFDSNTKFSAENKNVVGGISNQNEFTSGEGVNNPALLYNSVRHLFYSNFLSSGFLGSGSAFTTPSSSSITNNPNKPFGYYENNIQTSLPPQRHFPTSFGSDLKVYSISPKTYGESIVPGTFAFNGGQSDPNADGVIMSGANIEGNIFYDAGIIVTTGTNGDGSSPVNASSCSFSSSFTIYSTEYICTAGPNEFNYSLNPTLRDTETEYKSEVVNSPEFMPYVTTIGLYNENQELIMVGKLGQPVQLNPHTDTTFIIKLDR